MFKRYDVSEILTNICQVSKIILSRYARQRYPLKLRVLPLPFSRSNVNAATDKKGQKYLKKALK
jgi:hypothetical protein